MLIYIFDLVGVFAFAFLGARNAIEQKFNAWGIAACAFLPALGGGTIRSLILNKVPVYFHNYTYICVVLVAALLSAVLYRTFATLKMYVAILNAVGIVVFSYIGAHAAANAHLGLFGMVAFAVLSAFGGGVLCDIVSHKTPHVFNEDIWYGLPSVVLGVIYWMLGDALQQSAAEDWLLVSMFIMQLSMTVFTDSTLKKQFGLGRQFGIVNRLAPIRFKVPFGEED